MKKILILCLSLFCLPVFAAMPAIVNPINDASLAPMLQKVTPTVVNITVQKEVPYSETLVDDEDLPPSKRNKHPVNTITVGSGVVFDAEKELIVTNAHVVKDGKIIVITLKDGQRFRANLVAEDDGFDLAIVHIDAGNLKSLTFGDSDRLKVGDFVAAIGSPFGLTQTVTSGMVSALNRVEPHSEGFQSYIQTDAPINPGNSGGALVNMQGNLIGINTAIFSTSGSNTGIGFAIPSNMVHAVLTQLLEHGKVERGMLGILVQNISPEIAKALSVKEGVGVIVTDTILGSPARQVDIQAQDIIVKVNNMNIKTADQLRNMLGLMRPGTKLSLSIERDHKPLVIRATMGNPNKMAQPKNPFLAGLRLEDFNQLQADGTYLNGAIVVMVDENSDAALAGLLPGDVILMANSQRINSVKKLQEIANEESSQLLLKVARDNSKLFIVIQA